MKLRSWLKPAPAALTASDAGRALAALAAEQRARRTATTDTLRAFVAAGGTANLGWKL